MKCRTLTLLTSRILASVTQIYRKNRGLNHKANSAFSRCHHFFWLHQPCITAESPSFMGMWQGCCRKSSNLCLNRKNSVLLKIQVYVVEHPLLAKYSNCLVPQNASLSMYQTDRSKHCWDNMLPVWQLRYFIYLT